MSCWSQETFKIRIGGGPGPNLGDEFQATKNVQNESRGVLSQGAKGGSRRSVQYYPLVSLAKTVSP